MGKRIFNTSVQQSSTSSKIVVGLERISEAFKSLLRDYAKTKGLSPIQIQILIFVAYHKQELNTVSYLAKEFNVTKPTISDAVKALDKKGLISKQYSDTDSRTYTIKLSSNGEEMVLQTELFTDPIQREIEKIDSEELIVLYNAINNVVYNLNKIGVLTVQRTCYACGYYKMDKNGHYCQLLEKQLENKELRLDCPEFESKL